MTVQTEWPRTLSLVLAVLASLVIDSKWVYAAQDFSCAGYLDRSHTERQLILTSWMAGTSAENQYYRLNALTLRVEEAMSNLGSGTNASSILRTNVGAAISHMNEVYSMQLLAARHTEDFFSKVDEYCGRPEIAGAGVFEIIPYALKEMAESGEYSLLEYKMIIAPTDRVAEMHSSTRPGGTLDRGIYIPAPNRNSYCKDVVFPVELRGPTEVLLDVGANIGLNEIQIDAYDSRGEYIWLLPLVISEVDARNFTLTRNLKTRFVSYDARTVGSKLLRIRTFCDGQEENEMIVRLIVEP